MKKIFCCVLIFILTFAALGVLTACGGNNGKIVVKIGMWPDNSLPKDVQMFEQWKADFERDYPQYEIRGDKYDYSADTIISKATSGQLPTVFQTYFTEPQKLIENGWIADVTDELKELGWYDKMDADMRAAVSLNGRCYGVPRDGYGLGLFLNCAMLYDVGALDKNPDGSYKLYDESGKPLYPTTFQQIREVSQRVVDSYDNTYGLVVLSANMNGGWQFSNMAWNFGCERLQVPNGDGTYSANLNDSGAVAALEWIREMANDGLIVNDATLSYTDWYSKVGSRNAAMAFCGSDALMLPVTNFNFNKDDIAFVPMPSGDGISRYSLYGGTPYVFSSSASKDQIKGALLFLKYMGRSPETDEISMNAIELGYKTAQAKNMPILPTIRPWVNADYLSKVKALDDRYINVNYGYYKEFFDTIETMKRSEEPYYCQDMYKLLDNALQSVISKPGVANCSSLLTTANSQFYENYLIKVGK